MKEKRFKPHVNIGHIGHIDHGKTTLTAAITNTLVSNGFCKNGSNGEGLEKEELGITFETSHVEYETKNLPKKKSSALLGLMGMAAMLSGGMSFPGPSGQEICNDPNREKTPNDLAKLEAARSKRKRKMK